MKIKSITLALIIVLIISLFAGCAPKQEAQAPAAAEPVIENPDVLVIGGGGAGMVAAITAAEKGANVLLIEKMPMLGGNTLISATGITASDTALHEAAGRPFTKDEHFTKTMETGKNLANESLVRLLVDSSNEAYEWLLTLGLEYKLHDKDNFWIIPVEGHYGANLVRAMKTEMEKYPNLKVALETKATEIIVENNAVIGAKVVDKAGKESVINSGAVILATGGLNNAPELIAEFNPAYKGIHTEMTTPGATGDGIVMARAIGAKLVDMDLFQMRPLASNGNWYRETILTEEGKGGILVNTKGERFADETMKTWDLGSEILKQENGTAFVIFDAEMAETSDAKKAIELGKGVQADTIEALAELIGVDAASLKSTVDAYNAKEDPFNRKTLGKITVGPFYAVKTLPSSHYTMGGVAINANAEVLNEKDEVIANLYAAGEVVGGLYGAGRVAGNNTLDDIVFGKIAGSNAAAR